MSKTKPPSQRFLRSAGLHARRSMSATERAVASRQLTNRLFRAHEFTSAANIACFLSMEDEVDTHPVFARAWRAKKRIFAPVIDGRRKMVFHRLGPETRLYRNAYGLWEPDSQEEIDPRHLDLVLTPLAAFDSNNNRIGMGGGYFDRCFAFLKPRRHWVRPKLLGLAFDAQEVTEIAPNPWDIRLYAIATQTRISRLRA